MQIKKGEIYRPGHGGNIYNSDSLIGREQINIDMKPIEKEIKGKTVLVTGGAGSIGSEICRQVLSLGGKLIVFDIDENGLFRLDETLKMNYPPENYKIILGSIRDMPRLSGLFKNDRIDIVFHAAAHKHVPMMEANPGEAIKNNIFGTCNVAECAVKYKAEKFILISTDKAVNSTSIMGATKRIAEMLIKWFNDSNPSTILATVRFGNVLGSEGSVIPTFERQIKQGGPVTVTHPDMERYFMTIAEAVKLVLLACSMAKGSEIFVLDMGKPVRILDLAKSMIRLSGHEPDKDIKIEFMGLRPGEKMFEELSFDNEKLHTTYNDKIFVCETSGLNYDMEKLLGDLKLVIGDKNGENNDEKIRSTLLGYVSDVDACL